jgi:hypothetical protein
MPRATHLAWLVAASLLAACAGPSPRPPAPASPAVAGSAVAGSAPAATELSGIDVVFLTTMVGHSERTLQIVRLTRDRLRDDALRTLAAAADLARAQVGVGRDERVRDLARRI